MRGMSRTVVTAGAIAILALAAPAAEGRLVTDATSGGDRLLAASSVQTQGVVYTANTVVIPSALASAELAGISPDGSTFTFKSASGPLASLKAGSIMFLQGKTVAHVTGVSRSGGGLVVHTAPASIPDFIQSGSIAVSAPVTFGAGSFTSIVTPEPEITVNSIRRQTGSARTSASSEDEGTTYSGDIHGLQYKAIMDRGTERLGFEVDYSYDKDGLTGTIDATGYLDSFDAHMAMYVKNDLVNSSKFLAKPLDGHVHLNWSLARGPDAPETIKIPVITPPISWNVPFIAGGFPFFVKIEFQIKSTIAITAKNSTLSGGVDYTYSGSGGGSSVSGGLTPEGDEHVKGNFETPHALTLGASGAVIAVNFPKVTLGMGFSALNGNGYINVITSIGQTTGSLVAGQACSSYDLDVTIKAGLGAAIFKKIPKALLPSKTIYDKSNHYAQPGC
jgi:hypothetical protein